MVKVLANLIGFKTMITVRLSFKITQLLVICATCIAPASQAIEQNEVKIGSELNFPPPDVTNPRLFEKIKKLKEEVLPNLPCFAYPLNKADLLIKALGKEKVLLFAYGSLLNIESAKRTLSLEAIESYEPAIVIGYQRTFDRHVPKTKTWKKKARPNDTGMLNLFESEGVVNGILFQAGKEDLEAILKRERGYDLVPVIAIPWRKEDQDPRIAYTFIASVKPREGKHYTNNKINPIPGYALLAQKGAALWGKIYEQLWIDSTYLSDRLTPYAEWLNDPSIDLAKNK